MAKRKVAPEKLFSIIKNLIRTAEDLFGEKSGAAKKAWVVEKVNELIDIPVIGEAVEAKLIGALVDMIVAFFNEAKDRWGA